MINAGERLMINNRSFGYLSHRIVFYLLNLHIKKRHAYFVRVCREDAIQLLLLIKSARQAHPVKHPTKQMLVFPKLELTMQRV